MDKEIIANFCTRAFWNTNPEFDKEKKKFVPGDIKPESNKKFEKQFVDYGELSRQDAYDACWQFIHDLNINEALESDDPLIQTLAVIDKRVGKNRIKKINELELHPLAKKLLGVRLKIEKEGKS